LNRAWYALRKGRFKIAEDLCDSVVSDSPDCAEAYYCWALTESKIQLIWDYDEGKEQPILYDWDKAAHFGSSDYYQQALEYASDEERGRYESVAETIENVLEQLKEFEKMEREDGVTDLNCDCFICAKVSEVGGGKTKDHEYVMGGLYEALKDAGLRPFYSEVTLSQYTKGAYDYSAAILYVLSKVKCFLLVCENQDYLETPWVKNEYSWFCRYMEKSNVDWNERVLVVFDEDHPVRMPGRKKWQDFNRAGDVEILVDRVRDIVNTRTDEEKDQEIARLMEEQARLLAENERLRNAQQSVPAELTLSPATQAESGEKTVPEEPTDKKPEPFVINDGVLEKYNGTETDVVIPDGVTTIGESAFENTALKSVSIPKSVRVIGEETFMNCAALTSVTIPDSVTSIGDYAFSGCTALTSVTIPDGVTTIGERAFENTALKSVSIPKSVRVIDEETFMNCTALTSVTIPNGVTTIGRSAFENTALESVSIPKSVRVIGGEAFAFCFGLTSVTIPEGVKSIGGNAFECCHNLRSVTIPDSVTSVGIGAFDECERLQYSEYDNARYLGNQGNPYLVLYDAGENQNAGNASSCTVHDRTRVISAWAFLECESLTSVTIPSGVTQVGEAIFKDCANLKTVYCAAPKKPSGWSDKWLNDCDAKVVWESSKTLKTVQTALLDTLSETLATKASSVTEETNSDFVIKDGVLEKYNGTETGVVIPEGVTSIGTSAFLFCSGLTSVTIPQSVTSIGGSAFSLCRGLTSVTIPKGVTSIGFRAFYGCSGLTSATIPSSVKSIGNWAFSDCSGLTSITVAKGNPVYHSANNCLIETESKTLIAGCKASVIPNDGSVTSIGYSAFYGCSGLTSINIPNSVTSIEGWAFYGCSGLTSITIPSSVTSIGNWAFCGCKRLTVIIIPAGVKTIGKEAFAGCANLETVCCAAPAKSSGWSERWLGDCKAEVAWGYHGPSCGTSSKETSFSTEGNGSNFVIKDGVLEKYNGTETCVVIPEGVKTIGEKAFERSKLTSVTIPSSVTSIGDSAFYYCSGLTSVTIPKCVTSIGDWAFDGCSGLTSVNIPKGVTSIGDSAFFGCSGLTSVTIPNSVKSTGNGAFYGCSGLTSINIPNSVTSIGSSAFSLCSGLTSVTIPNSVKSIGNSAFYGCSGLTSINIPNSVTSIEGWAFYGCSGLTSVTIPNSVTSIGERAFYGCIRLTVITIPAGVKTIGEEAFAGCANLKTVCCAAPAKPSGWSDNWLGDCKAKVVWTEDKPIAENAKPASSTVQPAPSTGRSAPSIDWSEKAPIFLFAGAGVILLLGLILGITLGGTWEVRQWFIGIFGGLLAVGVCAAISYFFFDVCLVIDWYAPLAFILPVLMVVNVIVAFTSIEQFRVIFGCVSTIRILTGIGVGIYCFGDCEDGFGWAHVIEAGVSGVLTFLLLLGSF
ncbi:MAG: leucine-rich repeat protein, partial [Clostridia bacterium]|nr:leucine-rich repeat protein [Clostridia bacterium]